MKPPIDPFRCEVLEHVRYLTGFANKLTRNPDTAMDLLHDTIVRALRFQDHFMAGSNLRAWLSTMMWNLHVGGRKRAWRWVEMPPLVAEAQESPPDALDRLHLADVLAVVAKFSAPLREALMLAADGYQYDEIAERMHTPVGTAKSRVFRAREMLEGMR